MPQSDREVLEQLITERKTVEQNISTSIRELECLGLDVNDSLVDADGYPRGDIDIYRVRSLKASIARQQNDYKDIMKRIEFLLPKVIPSDGPNSMPLAATSVVPIAKIGIVPTGSLAFRLGLCTGDGIVKFGSLNHVNFAGNLVDFRSEFERVKAETQGYQGPLQSFPLLSIEIIRSSNGANHTFSLDLREADSLGCQILPLK